MRIPTDREILQAIYDCHAESLDHFDQNMADRDSKIMVPIDCVEIGKQLGVNPDIVFGRLYYVLEEKNGYDRDDESRVAFFARVAGKDRNCVNLPMVASVLAGLQEERSRHSWPLAMSIASLAISIAAIVLSALKP